MREVQERGAGEIVLNCMTSDGVRRGYDVDAVEGGARHLRMCRWWRPAAPARRNTSSMCSRKAGVDAALAASVFHSGTIAIPDLKTTLAASGIEVRL